MRTSLLGVILCTVMLQTVLALADNPPVAGDVNWTTITGIHGQIFPSATISTATSKEPFAYLFVKVRNVTAGQKIHATVKCDSLIDESSTDVTISKDQ